MLKENEYLSDSKHSLKPRPNKHISSLKDWGIEKNEIVEIVGRRQAAQKEDCR